MAIDREATLRKAENCLRAGKLDAAIGEYARVLEEQPKDWTTTNTLGDLYLRVGDADRAVALYQRIADHLLAEGFFPRAGALLKKILKIRPDDEAALVHLGDIAARQGLIAEARGYYTTVATRRSDRGDARGADELRDRLGSLDTALLLPSIAADLAAGELERARGRLQELLRTHTAPRAALGQLVDTLLPERVEAAALCVDAAVDHAIASGEQAAAAEILRQFAIRAPGHIPALLRLVEVGVECELDAVVHEAQAQLADAYLTAGRAEEARMIAEDLVTRDRTDAAHVERLRRALEMLDSPNVEAAIAERMTGPALDPLEYLEDEFTAPAPAAAAVDDPVVAAIMALGQQPVAAAAPDQSAPVAVEAAPAPELDHVFAGLRAEAAADPAEDESEEYVALARSYLEMGSRDDAIEAFLIAVKSPRNRFTCASALAQLYRDNGDIPAAIEWYERAAEAPPPSPEDGLKLMYDLGDLLETLGENARALAVFMEVDAEGSGFLDVAARIERLSSDQVGG